MKVVPALCALMMSITVSVHADDPIELDLWPEGGVPGLKEGEEEVIAVKRDARIGTRVTKVTKPKLTVYKPEKSKDTGAAVLICPGGGYHILAYDLEGVEVAKWLNSIGVTGVVMHYRVPRSRTEAKHFHPLQDAQRAMGLVRENADKWGIDGLRVGVLGFSAGGHLTAALSTTHFRRSYTKIDHADEQSCRPDFSILVYPAYLAVDKDLELEPEIAVDRNTPPAFLVHAGDDRISPKNSIAYYLALKSVGVEGELHIYPSGGHGYGLRPTNHAVTSWPDRAARWLKSMGIISDLFVDSSGDVKDEEDPTESEDTKDSEEPKNSE